MNTDTKKTRKTPFATHFPFSKRRLMAIVDELYALGIDQVEVADTESTGHHSMVYRSGTIAFYAVYRFNKKSKRKRLGTLETLTIDEARAKNREIRRCLDNGIDPNAVVVKTITYNTHFYRNYVQLAKSRNKKSVDTDLSRHENHLQSEIGHLPLDEITPDIVCRLYLNMRSKELSVTTVKHVMDQLKGCLNLAVKLDLLNRNPAMFLDRLPRAPQSRDFPTAEDLARFRASAQADEAVIPARMLELGVLSAARSGEVMELKWVDLDLPNRLWCLSSQKSQKSRWGDPSIGRCCRAA